MIMIVIYLHKIIIYLRKSKTKKKEEKNRYQITDKIIKTINILIRIFRFHGVCTGQHWQIFIATLIKYYTNSL